MRRLCWTAPQRGSSMQTENLSSASTLDTENAPPPRCEQTQPLKPRLASIPNACAYMGDVSCSKFYADVLPLVDSVYIGTRHFVVVESMDRLIAAKATASTAVTNHIASPALVSVATATGSAIKAASQPVVAADRTSGKRTRRRRERPHNCRGARVI